MFFFQLTNSYLYLHMHKTIHFLKIIIYHWFVWFRQPITCFKMVDHVLYFPFSSSIKQLICLVKSTCPAPVKRICKNTFNLYIRLHTIQIVNTNQPIVCLLCVLVYCIFNFFIVQSGFFPIKITFNS